MRSVFETPQYRCTAAVSLAKQPIRQKTRHKAECYKVGTLREADDVTCDQLQPSGAGIVVLSVQRNGELW